MKSPWKDIESPFAPMYDECVVFTLADGARRSVPCCVFLDETGAALAEDAAVETSREDILISTPCVHHDFVRTLRRGDRLSRLETNRKTYTVQSVDWDQTMGLIVKARSV